MSAGLEEELLRVEFHKEQLRLTDDPLAFAVSETLQIVQRGDCPPDVRVLANSARKISVVILVEV